MEHSKHFLNTLNKDSLKQPEPTVSIYHHMTDLEGVQYSSHYSCRPEGKNKDFQPTTSPSDIWLVTALVCRPTCCRAKPTNPRSAAMQCARFGKETTIVFRF